MTLIESLEYMIKPVFTLYFPESWSLAECIAEIRKYGDGVFYTYGHSVDVKYAKIWL
jgi:hypothetical protein